MNKQLKHEWKDGARVPAGRGIEWTDYTWNVIGGCEHDCEWQMPDGTWAECYAKTVAERLAKDAYDKGFKAHYWHPERLKEPEGAPAGSKIFLDSMADLFGHWVPEEQINQVLDVVRRNPQLHFQSLTKNAARLKQFQLPSNLWIGVSAPPTRMHGKELSPGAREAYVFKQLDILFEIVFQSPDSRSVITWMSIEPLSFDIATMFERWCLKNNLELPLRWAVIGAASKGSKLFQPDPIHVEHCHRVLRNYGVKIFHKGNLIWEPHLEEWPI